jgi:hypothetical protein
MIAFPYVAIFLCTLVIEVGWIWSVRSVAEGRRSLVVMNAVLMQGISNLSTLILVHDSWTSVTSVIGAAVGAFIGMRFTFRGQSAD